MNEQARLTNKAHHDKKKHFIEILQLTFVVAFVYFVS